MSNDLRGTRCMNKMEDCTDNFLRWWTLHISIRYMWLAHFISGWHVSYMWGSPCWQRLTSNTCANCLSMPYMPKMLVVTIVTATCFSQSVWIDAFSFFALSISNSCRTSKNIRQKKRWSGEHTGQAWLQNRTTCLVCVHVRSGSTSLVIIELPTTSTTRCTKRDSLWQSSKMSMTALWQGIYSVIKYLWVWQQLAGP